MPPSGQDVAPGAWKYPVRPARVRAWAPVSVPGTDAERTGRRLCGSNLDTCRALVTPSCPCSAAAVHVQALGGRRTWCAEGADEGRESPAPLLQARHKQLHHQVEAWQLVQHVGAHVQHGHAFQRCIRVCTCSQRGVLPNRGADTAASLSGWLPEELQNNQLWRTARRSLNRHLRMPAWAGWAAHWCGGC